VRKCQKEFFNEHNGIRTFNATHLQLWHLWHKNNGKINETSFAKQGYALVAQWHNT
jgi:hypothetical protein